MNMRLLMLPVEKINKNIPVKGIIYDIGCGKGDLGFILSQRNPKRQIISIDTDRAKITMARCYYKASNIKFIIADVLTFRYQSFQGAVLSDFLHHIPFSAQEKLLMRLAKKISNEGRLIIKEIDKASTIRMLLSRFWEFIFYPRDRIYYRSKKEWTDILISLGLTVVSSYEVGWFPGSTTLFICTKKK